tara:strand:+ start:3941 stop:4267 length:327 start_codon:yes stop_codon:yes gene_type:complete
MATNNFANAQSAGVTGQTTIYTSPAGQTSILLEADVANSGAGTATVDVRLYDNSAGTNAYLVKGANILVGSAMKVVSGQKIILDGDDYISVTSDIAVDVVCSILEDVN